MKYVTRCQRHSKQKMKYVSTTRFYFHLWRTSRSVKRKWCKRKFITFSPSRVEHITFTYVPEWTGVTNNEGATIIIGLSTFCCKCVDRLCSDIIHPNCRRRKNAINLFIYWSCKCAKSLRLGLRHLRNCSAKYASQFIVVNYYSLKTKETECANRKLISSDNYLPYTRSWPFIVGFSVAKPTLNKLYRINEIKFAAESLLCALHVPYSYDGWPQYDLAKWIINFLIKIIKSAAAIRTLFPEYIHLAHCVAGANIKTKRRPQRAKTEILLRLIILID